MITESKFCWHHTDLQLLILQWCVGNMLYLLNQLYEMIVTKVKSYFFFLNIISQMNSYSGTGLWMNIQGYDKLDFILDMLWTLWYTFRANIEKKWGKNWIASHCLNRCFYTQTIVLFCFFHPTNGNVLLNILLLKSWWTYLFLSAFSSSQGSVRFKCITLKY